MGKKKTYEELLNREIKPIVKPLYIANETYYPRGPDEVFLLTWDKEKINTEAAKYYNRLRDEQFDKHFEIKDFDHNEFIPALFAQPQGMVTITISVSEIKNKQLDNPEDELKDATVSVLKECLKEANIKLEKKITKQGLIEKILSIMYGEF
jgi:hypothetical protein